MEREPNGALTSFSGAPDELLIRVFAAPAAGVQELPNCLARQRAEISDKPFIEGLIQLSTACRLIEDFGEIKGPVKLIYQALIRFENYQPTYLEVKIADLTAAIEAWAKEIEASGARGQKPVPTIAVRRFGFF
jgi:hypothetical protein